MMIRKFLYFICFIIGISNIYAMELKDCLSFYEIARNNPNNLYIASLNVGTGECHVIRKGNRAIIVDAGARNGPFSPQQMIPFIEMILSEAILYGVFITHLHKDHINMLGDIIDSDRIQKSARFRIFLGGIGSYNIVSAIERENLLSEGRYNDIIDGLGILAYNVDHVFKRSKITRI